MSPVSAALAITSLRRSDSGTAILCSGTSEPLHELNPLRSIPQLYGHGCLGSSFPQDRQLHTSFGVGDVGQFFTKGPLQDEQLDSSTHTHN